MNIRDHKILLRDKQNLARRLERHPFTDQPSPIFKDANIGYEIADRIRAIGCGGIGALHPALRDKLGLDRAINKNTVTCVPHHAAQVSPSLLSNRTTRLSIAYNVLTGGTCLEDIERLRNDATYMNGLGAKRIPDPIPPCGTGDFLRRFDGDWIFALLETINETRTKVWRLQDSSFREQAIIDLDGTVAETTGECKEGMDIAYNGIWGYASLIVSLANTNEVLYLVNRPGNRPSSDAAAPWIGRAIDLAAATFKKVWLRGDTDFSLTANFDRWDQRVSAGLWV